MAKPSDPFIQFDSPATIFPSIELEPDPSSLFLPPPDPVLQPLAIVQTELQQQQQPHQHQEEEEEEQQQKGQPQLFKSIDDLTSLSSAILAFKCRFDELTKHLDYINQAIDSQFNEPQKQKRPQIEIQSLPKTTETDGETEKKGPDAASPPKSGIQCLCEMMCGKGLRKYIAFNLSNVPKLREEVPEALKFSPEPAKLILDCIGRFYLQGIKAYSKDSPMILSRQASVLALEFFLLMMRGFNAQGKVKIARELKAEANEGAIAWRKRLITEGGLAKATEVDARGLLLFVSCFGIPKLFRIEDMWNLLRLCNLRAIADALKASPVLPHRMPDIIEAMAKNGMHVDAVDVASIFGLEDKFSVKKILTLFLQESAKTFKKAKQDAQNSSVSLRSAIIKQLDDLKSVVHYMEDGSSDVAKFLSSWKIYDKIIKLEEENAELDRRIEEKGVMPKRKLDEIGSSSRVMSQEMKRSRFGTIGSPLPKSSHVNGLHEQRTTSLTEGRRLFDDLMPKAYDSANSGHITSYPTASSLPRGQTVGSLQVGINGVGSSGMIAGICAISKSPYSMAHTEIEIDNAGQTRSSSALPSGGWQHHSVRQSSSMRFADLYGNEPSPSVKNFPGLLDSTNRTSANLYQFADSIEEKESYTSSSHRTSALSNAASVRQLPYMY